MSSYNSISEAISIESEIEEDAITSSLKEHTIESSPNEYSSKFDKDSQDLQKEFIGKKLKFLKRKALISALPNKKVDQNSSIFSEKIEKLRTLKHNYQDKFYCQPADPCLISKLLFENKLYAIKCDADYSDIQASNIELLEEYKQIEQKKFITAQYYRLLSKK